MSREIVSLLSEIYMLPSHNELERKNARVSLELISFVIYYIRQVRTCTV